MHIKLSDIIHYSSAKVQKPEGLQTDNIEINSFAYDTRKVVSAENGMFICLAKHSRDILSHVAKAYNKGLRYFLVPERFELPPYKDVVFLVVRDVLLSLQKIASEHRHKMHSNVIGITGSNGKTISKEWLSQILEKRFSVVKSPASYNSQLGVALSVLQMEKHHDFGIFEAGISQPGEMAKLQPIIDCQYGILTNIGDAHDEGFQNQEEKLAEKIYLFRNARQLIFQETTHTKKDKISQSLNSTLINWSFNEENTGYQVDIKREDTKVNISLSGRNSFQFDFHLADKASISNIINIAILCFELGIEESYFKQQIQHLESVSMRLVLKKAMHNCLVIDDSYNADLSSLENALDFAIQQKKERSLHLILSDFDQIKQDEAYKNKLNRLIKDFKVDHISYIGEKSSVLNQESTTIRVFSSRDELEDHFQLEIPRDQLLLLKGARRFQLDQLISSFSDKSHRTELIIDLDSIHQNIKSYRGLIPSGTKIMSVIKAEAYGSDSVTLAKHLLRCGVEYLAVAYYDEALELRKEGILSPIMVMNPDASLTNLAVEYDLELEVYSLPQVKTILAQARSMKMSSKSKVIFHIKIDTGMHRLGFHLDEIQELLKLISDSGRAEIRSVFSHFSSAEDPDADSFTKLQHQYLLSAVEEIERSLEIGGIMKHICNSTAAWRFPEYHHDMIRLGIGMYGYVPVQEAQFAHKLVTYVAQVKELKLGDHVGYNNLFTASEAMTIATLCIGYADGISRKLGLGQFAFSYQDHKLKTIGNISMDTCSVDVTGLEIAVGDEVVVFDTKVSFDVFAKASEKSSYEAISNIGQRVVRNYVKY